MTTESTKYLKRIQAWVNPRLKAEGLVGVTYDQIRTVWFDNKIIVNPEQPSEKEYMLARQTVLENIMKVNNQPQNKPLSVYTDGSVDFESKDEEGIQEVDSSIQSSIDLVDEWIQDESSYDEENYTQIEQALINNRMNDQGIGLINDHASGNKEGDKDDDRGSGSMVPIQPSNLSPLSAEVNNNNIIDIREIVEQQFSDKGSEVQEMIIQYAEEKMYTNVNELQEALTDINNTELSVMLKVSDDYIKQREHNQQTIQQHLMSTTEGEQKKSQIRAMQRIQKMSHYRSQFGIMS